VIDTTIKVYTVQEVMEILKLSQNTVLTMLKDGRLKGVKIGRFWRISEENLRAFLNGGVTK
jgi:excisionase family DNA binding protein